MADLQMQFNWTLVLSTEELKLVERSLRNFTSSEAQSLADRLKHMRAAKVRMAANNAAEDK